MLFVGMEIAKKSLKRHYTVQQYSLEPGSFESVFPTFSNMNMSRIIINVVLIINYSGPSKTSGHGHGTQKPVALEDDLLDS